MDDFLIAFGALWVVICAYAIVAYHIRGIEHGTAPPPTPSPWISDEASMPAHAGSGACHSRWPRRTSRQRLLRCATRPPRQMRSSRT